MEKSNNSVQTRHNEKRFKTSDQREMIGYYLAKPVMREWTEDFLDKDTGEISTITRHERIKDAGALVTQELAQELAFYVQSGEIEEVELSTQSRKASSLGATSHLWPYQVGASINDKAHRFLLSAVSVKAAIEVAKDWIELHYEGGFAISSVKGLGRALIIDDSLQRLDEVSEEADEEGKAAPASYYKVEADVTTGSDDEGKDAERYTFYVKTKDVDSAKGVLIAWINNKLAGNNPNGAQEVAELTIISAAPYNCKEIIDRAFCEVYRVNEEGE